MNKRFLIISSTIYLLLTSAVFTLLYRFPHYWSIFILLFILIFSVYIYLITKNSSAKKPSAIQNEDMLDHLLENINAMVVIWSDDFSYVNVNNIFTEITGYSKEDCRSTDILKSIIPSKDIASVKNDKNEFASTIKAKNGNELDIIWNSSLINLKNETLILSVGFDNTKTSQMRQKMKDFSKDLEATQNRYTLSMELSEIGIILRKIDSDTFFISEQFKTMLGVNSDYININELRDLIHPNDKVLFDAYCEANCSLGDIHKIHNAELRILSNDGTYHWYAFRYKVAESIDGKPSDIGGAIIDITKDKEKDSLIEKMAYIDELTEIYNRNKFIEIGEETFDCSVDLNIMYWVIVIDIDRFHIINDTCGYQNGNRLLKEVAITILKNLNDGGFGARIGGDNFALIIKDNGDETLPIKTIKNIQAQLAGLAVDVFSNQTITCSAGFCKMPTDANSFQKVLDHAEFALSLNDDTRGSIKRYDNKTHDNIIADSTIEIELAKALELNQLILYYQPKIDLATGNIIGAEALIRWQRPDGRLISPGFFIPVAENSLLITKISDFVLYEACRQNKKWQNEGFPKFSVSINLTSVDFYQTDVKKSISEALKETGLDPRWLEVELTESLALKDVEQAIHQMRELSELGVKISMDDFGTGYSSLSYIQVLPITLLKLDRSFIMYLEEDEVSREIVSAVIKIAKSKKIQTIAEGIETLGQAEILKKSGCDQAQGYFFGKPMPVKEFEEFLLKKHNNVVNV